MTMVTKNDIALSLGVSRGCVSQVLNNTPGSRVSPELRQRIIEAAMEMNYLTGKPAPAVTKQTMIAYVLCWSYLKQRANPGGWHLGQLYAFQQIASRHGQVVVFMAANRLASSIKETLHAIDTLAPAGVILDGIVPSVMVNEMNKRKLPCVVTGAQPYAYEDKWEGKVSTVAPERSNGLALLMAQLYKRGSRKIGLMLDTANLFHSKILLEVYRDTIHKLGLKYDPAFVQITDQIEHGPTFTLLSRYADLGIDIDGLLCPVTMMSWLMPQLRNNPLPSLNEQHIAVIGNVDAMSFPGKGEVVSLDSRSSTFAAQVHKLLVYLIRHPEKRKRVFLSRTENSKTDVLK